ncbi:MAG TPA: bacillithiol system redox-active protein YtxJ [Planctomycetota bacterium]|jgi:bacillithiol system protein YtxJ|nr:bacillithiol system redox-active protein YtxJ [Planctomycetota bacterium]
MSTETLHDLAAWRAAIGRHPLVMLFKHSPICPVSTEALEEWQRFRLERPELPALFVDVIADRAVARELAQECGVAHQSPQAILFKDGRPVWHASHGAITAAALAQASQQS